MAAEQREGTDNFFAELGRYSSEQERLRWTGEFREYWQRVTENPKLVRTAHRTLYETVTSRPDFFETGENALYGLEDTTKKLTETLKAAAEGLEPKKRILLLMGPVGGGKSTLVTALKRGLEQYSKTDHGAVYAIADCPMQEEPLHLVPQEMRSIVEERYGVHVEGNPCPKCNKNYGDKKGDELARVPVKRVVLSEKDRVGVGTFAPSDPKSQDITELVGSINLSALAEVGRRSDPEAYNFDGELNVANRGLMEFVEMLKVDEKFLYTLLSLAQEQIIKVPQFANISADEVVMAHTNESEYAKFVGKKENEALKDRIIVISVPYNLKVSSERKIYDKLINQSDLMRNSAIHISPHTLRLAAIFAVYSRLEQSKKAGLDQMKKLKMYDGEQLEDIKEADVKEEREAHPREGMEGISPRYVIDSLSTALIKEGRSCLTPIDALRALRDGLDFHPHTRDLDNEKKDKIKNSLAEVRREYDEMAKKDVQKAFVHEYESSVRDLCNNYLDNVEAFINNTKLKDPITEEEIDPDERLMRSIEEQNSITENAKKDFRQEINNRVAQLGRKGERFDHNTHPRLKEALEKKLFDDLKDVVKITTSTKHPDPEQLGKINEVARRLTSERGYCAHCAQDLVKYVGTLLNR